MKSIIFAALILSFTFAHAGTNDQALESMKKITDRLSPNPPAVPKSQIDLLKGIEYRDSRRLGELSKEEAARLHMAIVFGNQQIPIELQQQAEAAD